jgi:hypothetical protein
MSNKDGNNLFDLASGVADSIKNAADQAQQASHAGKADNSGYYQQGEGAEASGNSRLNAGLQDTPGMTQSARSINDALAATYNDTPGQGMTSSARSINDALTNAPANEEGTYAGFADADTVPGNVEGWAGSENLPDTDDEEFVGSGGVGSADYMKRIREGHQAAGDVYTSNLYGADEIPNDPDKT